MEIAVARRDQTPRPEPGRGLADVDRNRRRDTVRPSRHFSPAGAAPTLSQSLGSARRPGPGALRRVRLVRERRRRRADRPRRERPEARVGRSAHHPGRSPLHALRFARRRLRGPCRQTRRVPRNGGADPVVQAGRATDPRVGGRRSHDSSPRSGRERTGRTASLLVRLQRYGRLSIDGWIADGPPTGLRHSPPPLTPKWFLD